MAKAKTKSAASTKRKVTKAAKKVAEVDQTITHKAAGVRDTRAMKVFAALADVADQPPLIAASLGTLAIGLITKRGDLTRGGARMLASHLLATGAKLAIKQQVARTRPSAAIDKGEQKFKLGETGEHDETSFPSGHTAGAVAVARAASREIDGAAAPGALAVGAVAAAQAPAGNHYLSDVVAGAVIGWAAEAVVSAVFDRLEPKVEQAMKPQSSRSGREDKLNPASAAPPRS
jgi:membrane-associated phospholipid phosphatase